MWELQGLFSKNPTFCGKIFPESGVLLRREEREGLCQGSRFQLAGSGGLADSPEGEGGTEHLAGDAADGAQPAHAHSDHRAGGGGGDLAGGGEEGEHILGGLRHDSQLGNVRSQSLHPPQAGGHLLFRGRAGKIVAGEDDLHALFMAVGNLPADKVLTGKELDVNEVHKTAVCQRLNEGGVLCFRDHSPAPLFDSTVSGQHREVSQRSAEGLGGVQQGFWEDVFPTIRTEITPAIAQRECFSITPCDANGTRKDRPDGGLYVTSADASKTLTRGNPNTETVVVEPPVIALDGDQFVTMTTGGDPSTTTHLLDLVLRGTWSLDLANSIPTYTSGESTYPKAVVQFYDGGTTAPTASTFAPSVYHPTGEDGANEITTVNNSDGADHYIIMHVAPTPNGGYWTDERLLYVMEGASAGARSRGPGISLNLPELLKRDLNDPSDPSQGYRYDGAGWYYYKLPASHCVANGYTKSTLYVEATRWFDLNDTDDSDGDKVVQDGKKITVPNHEGWTAEILLDEVTFEFDGAVKTPQITQIAFNNGSGTLFTLTDGFDNLLKVNGTKHIGLFPPKDECMIECVGTGWFNGTTPTATETTPAPVSYLVTVPLPVDDTSAERGTETNPWLVSTIAQMTLFGQCVDDGAYDFDGKYVRLTADLEYDATATNNYTPIGSGTPFAGTFFGTTDTGTPHVISGIRYAGTPALDKVGLFSQLGKNGGTGAVKDLQLKDCKFDASNLSFPSGFAGGALAASVMGTQISNVTVTSSKIIGADNVGAVTSVGGLAGNISQASTVSGCTVNGNTYVNSQVSNDLDNEEAYCQVGGIAGYAHGSEISGCTVDDCSIYSFHSGDNCPGNEVGGIVGSAPYGVRLLNNRVTGNTQFFDNIQSNNYSKIGAIYGNNYGTGGDTDISIGDVGYAIFMNNYYDISVDISYLNGSMSETKYIVGYMPRGTRVFTYNENPPYNLISVEFGDVTYGTVGYNNNDPADPIKDTNDAAKMYVKPATITLTAGTGRSLVFTETTTPKQADDTHPADCYAIDVDPIDGSPLTYYYAPGQFIPITVTYQQRTDDVRTFYDEVTITAKDGSAAQADVTLSPNGLPTPSGSATPSGITTYTQDFFFAMPADGVDVTADISESQWFTINTVNYNADDPSAPNAYNWMTFYHDWTDGTGTAATPANYKVTNYDNPLLDVEVMTVSRVNSADGWFALAEIDGGICYSGVPTIFHYAVANDATAVLPQKLKFTPVDPNDPQAPTGGYAEPTVAPQFQGVIDPAGKTLTADDKCYILNNAGDFILAYPTEGDDQIAAHKCYIDWNIEGNGNTPAPARLVLTGGNTGIERILLDGSSDGDWYSLDGRRLNGQPARKGIYINKGKKTVVK